LNAFLVLKALISWTKPGPLKKPLWFWTFYRLCMAQVIFPNIGFRLSTKFFYNK